MCRYVFKMQMVNVAVHEETKVKSLEIERLTAEVERLRSQGRDDEADAVTVAAENLSSGMQTPRPQTPGLKSSVQGTVGGSDTPNVIEMEEMDSLTGARAKLMSEWQNDGVNERFAALDKTWVEVDREVLLTRAGNELPEVAVRREGHHTWPRDKDVKVKFKYRTTLRTKRCVSASPLRIRNDNVRSVLFGRKRGRPRVYTPGFDGRICCCVSSRSHKNMSSYALKMFQTYLGVTLNVRARLA